MQSSSDKEIEFISARMATVHFVFLVLVLFPVILVHGVLAINEKYDPGSLEKEEPTRERRVAGTEDQAQIPRNNPGFPFMMSPNLQASYFLGQCVMCPPGDPGPRGAPGPQGMPGRDGRDQIIIGPLGGHAVESPVTSQPGDGPGASAGVIYTRWGKTECPSTSQLVYEGVMGGSNDYTQKGSGVNYLCMPLEPTFGDPPSHADGAFLFGVEYENTLPTSRDIHQSEAPCAVCLAQNKGTVMTVPGTNTCLGDQDWTLEYTGYMMSSHYTHYKSEFVCIDQHAEGIPRTNHNNNEPILYMADVKCSASGGGLPCPPYVDGYDILCAVCTL